MGPTLKKTGPHIGKPEIPTPRETAQEFSGWNFRLVCSFLFEFFPSRQRKAQKSDWKTKSQSFLLLKFTLNYDSP